MKKWITSLNRIRLEQSCTRTVLKSKFRLSRMKQSKHRTEKDHRGKSAVFGLITPIKNQQPNTTPKVYFSIFSQNLFQQFQPAAADFPNRSKTLPTHAALIGISQKSPLRPSLCRTGNYTSRLKATSFKLAPVRRPSADFHLERAFYSLIRPRPL